MQKTVWINTVVRPSLIQNLEVTFFTLSKLSNCDYATAGSYIEAQANGNTKSESDQSARPLESCHTFAETRTLLQAVGELAGYSTNLIAPLLHSCRLGVGVTRETDRILPAAFSIAPRREKVLRALTPGTMALRQTLAMATAISALAMCVQFHVSRKCIP